MRGWWLGLSVLATLLIADWFFGSFTRTLVRGQAEIDVRSEPAGARVFADTLDLGVTPLIGAVLPPGRYLLRVEHAYSLPHGEPLVVARGDKVSRSIVLEPGFGNLSLVSNPRGAAVTIDGQRYDGVTPLIIEQLAAGLHEVSLSLPARKRALETIAVLPGQRAEMNAELNRVPLGQLVVASVPAGAQVEVLPGPDEQGSVAAELPDSDLTYSKGMTLPVRSYLVRVSQPGWEPQERRIRLRRGENRLAFELARRLGELTVVVDPSDATVRVSAGGKSVAYSQPLLLPVGKVQVSASRHGYRTKTKTLELETGGTSLALRLHGFNVEVGRIFRDALASGGSGPELVVLAAGSFRMGDLSGEGAADERPAHQVQLREPFALGVREVSNAQWQQQFGKTGDNKPVVKVSRQQIGLYLRWLDRETGASYRLPSEAEWEYAARAGTTHSYATTPSIDELCRWANVADQRLGQRYTQWDTIACDDGVERLAATGSYEANAFGLYDMIGNASEWLADCSHDNYLGAPTDGRVWGRNCSSWVARGGAWDNAGDRVRVSHREQVSRAGGELGLRVVREL